MLIATPAAAAPTDPGVVSDVRPLPSAQWLPNTAEASLLTYWSVGPHGVPMKSTGVVYLPEGQAPEGGWPVISYAHGTTGIADHCAPSRGVLPDLIVNKLNYWLTQGYAVVATDYVGLGTDGVHPYLHGESASNSVIDMVRAARSVTPSLSNSWAALGQSQGGQAVLFTAHRATTYAPELDFRGTASTSAPSNIENLAFLGGPRFPDIPLSGTPTYIASIFTGVRAHYPEVDIDSYLTPLGRSIVDDIENNLCYDEAGKKYVDVTIGQLFSRPVDQKVVTVAHELLEIPPYGYDRPLFVAQGREDRDVPIPLTLKLIADMRMNGVNVDFHTYPTGHTSVHLAAEEDITEFMAGLF
ncbi:MAG: lipase, partial [Rhodococcus sp.]|nr:lipase [Rhodococcus sp. (in: high G+C Gram-positive bacteria)]